MTPSQKRPSRPVKKRLVFNNLKQYTLLWMKPIRLAQISDFHITHLTWNPLRLFSKRFLGNLNWLFSRKGIFSTEAIDALPSFLSSLQLDHILLGGDFTTTSLPEEFRLARAFVDKLPAPWIAIPGNHDQYTYRAYRQKRYYQSLSNPREAIRERTDFFNLSDHGLEAHRLAPKWWLIALDTTRATNLYSSRGFFSPKLEERLNELLSMIPSDHSILLLNHYPFFQNVTVRHSLSRGNALEALLRKEPRIKAYLHGHSHRHTIADLQPSNLPLILDGGACAEGTWNLLTIDEKQIKIDVYRWKNSWQLDRTEEIAWNRGLQKG